MYFEQSKKTYYRFPSTNSVNDLDSRYYFPEKPSHIEMDTRMETSFANHTSDHSSYRNV
jgi:hypothetical protein